MAGQGQAPEVTGLESQVGDGAEGTNDVHQQAAYPWSHDLDTTSSDSILHHTDTGVVRWPIWTWGRVRQAGTRMVPCASASAAMSVSQLL